MKLKKPLLSPEEREYWNVYIHHPDWRIRFDIAYCSETPLWILEQMINDYDDFVLIALCSNPNTSPEMLDNLIEISVNTKRTSMIDTILHHPNLSEKSYLKLAAIKKFKRTLLKPST